MNEQHDLVVGYHVVCVIDVLGQTRALTGWSDLPEDGRLSESMVVAVKKTVGAVLGFEHAFREYFETVAQCTMPALLTRLSAAQQEEYRRFKDCELNVQQFSDTFVFYARTVNRHGALSPVPLYRILGACSVAMLLSLAARIPVRGSIAIGPGLELADRNFYGPALAEAHHLESRVAGYPRIVISPSVDHYLHAMERGPAVGLRQDMLLANLQASRLLLTKDNDGWLIVDFMGQAIRDLIGADTQTREAVAKGYEFVAAEAERFRRDSNDKLADRYAQLRRYMNSRMPLWQS